MAEFELGSVYSPQSLNSATSLRTAIAITGDYDDDDDDDIKLRVIASLISV